jgi:hypothetical protein
VSLRQRQNARLPPSQRWIVFQAAPGDGVAVHHRSRVSYDVAKDGRILALVTPESRAARPLTLVQGWTAALKER